MEVEGKGNEGKFSVFASAREENKGKIKGNETKTGQRKNMKYKGKLSNGFVLLTLHEV